MAAFHQLLAVCTRWCEKQPRILVIVLPLGKDSEMIGDDDCNYLNHLGATCQKNSWLAATPSWEWILKAENSYFLGISQTRQTIRVHELLCNYCLSGWWWSSTIITSQTENKTSDERSYEGTQQTEDQTSARIHLRLCRMGNTHTHTTAFVFVSNEIVGLQTAPLAFFQIKIHIWPLTYSPLFQRTSWKRTMAKNKVSRSFPGTSPPPLTFLRFDEKGQAEDRQS